ncbi:MAG: hypothetical protein EZS28_032074 [Streblomastix strix]|uniref:Uncharacterized protein n=1 Tax=Streblomastix strix TaxID=222440 RepID=A0A5J4UQU9_9EUKA|nr:MAG: hypothetical protein EZS28_032074 [Streblomastix strix]
MIKERINLEKKYETEKVDELRKIKLQQEEEDAKMNNGNNNKDKVNSTIDNVKVNQVVQQPNQYITNSIPEIKSKQDVLHENQRMALIALEKRKQEDEELKKKQWEEKHGKKNDEYIHFNFNYDNYDEGFPEDDEDEQDNSNTQDRSGFTKSLDANSLFIHLETSSLSGSIQGSSSIDSQLGYSQYTNGQSQDDDQYTSYYTKPLGRGKVINPQVKAQQGRGKPKAIMNPITPKRQAMPKAPNTPGMRKYMSEPKWK